MKKKIFFLLILLLPFMVSAEEISLKWQEFILSESDETSIDKILETENGFIAIYNFGYDEEGDFISEKAHVVKYDNNKKEWLKSIDGNGIDYFQDMILFEDNSIAVIGTFTSTDIESLENKGSEDGFITKYDKDGNMLWQKSWGGSGWDTFNKIYSTEDDGIIVIGGFQSTDIEGLVKENKYDWDQMIIKYDKDGNMLWQKSWGGSDYDHFEELFFLKDGSFISRARTYSKDIDGLVNEGKSYEDGVIIKYDKDGNMLWQKSLGSYARNIKFTDNESMIIVGVLYSEKGNGLISKGGADAIIFKYDKDGNMLWQKSWGGNFDDSFYDLILLKDESIIAVGEFASTDIDGLVNEGNQYYDDIILVKYDEDGNMLWQKSWGGNNDESLKHVVSTKKDEFIVIGNFKSNNIDGIQNNGYSDTIILKYDKDGNILWQKSWGGSDYADYFNEIYMMNDDSFIIVGEFNSTDIQNVENKGESDIILMKYDKNGNILLQKSWGGNKNEYGSSIFTQNNGIIIIGETTSTDIGDATDSNNRKIFMLNYSIDYDIENVTNTTNENTNGTSTIEQQGRYGIVKPIPNEGYEVDKIIVKDKSGNVLDVEVTKQEDGTYSFELYTDVSVEVLFKEKLVNPKTGVSSFIGVMFTLMLIGISSFFMIKNCNNSYEL